MMKAKRIILSIISAVLIALMMASFIPISYMVRPEEYNRDNIAGFYAEESNSLDMVYIGGSACFVYWEVLRAWNQYGFTSYNFAHDTITPEAVKYYIKEARKTQNPKLWLIDLRPFQYGEESYSSEIDTPNMYYEVPIRNGTDHMLYSKNRNELIDTSVKNKSEIIPYYVDFIKYHSNWRNICLNAFRCLQTKSVDPIINNNIKSNPLKGFYFIEKTLPVDFTDYSSVTEETTIPDEVNDLFLDLVDYCKQEKLTVLFIVHSYCQTEDHKKEYNYMRRIIEENGFDFLNTNDYYKDIGLDYSMDLYNENHVNVFGAEKYTDFVAKYIDMHYDLPDKRDQAEYADWNRLYDEFELKTDEVKKVILDLRNKQSENESNTK